VIGGVFHLRHQVAGHEHRAALAASDLIRVRIHTMPSGSSPLTGSSNINSRITEQRRGYSQPLAHAK
jgi:hypothetical protein